MTGTEKIDDKERISGNAVVGLSFFQGCENFDPGDIHVYLGSSGTDSSTDLTLTAQVSTVDGRYFFTAKREDVDAKPRWQQMELKKEQGNRIDTLNTSFIGNYDHSELAVLVKDQSGRYYPVRCGCASSNDNVRIHVNAEGADAYFAETHEGKPRLSACTRVDDESNFKFDHYCDIGFKDIAGIDPFPIIRKRGATFENRINVHSVFPQEENKECGK